MLTTVIYFLQRYEVVASNRTAEIYDWVKVPNSERSDPYPKEELEDKECWRQIKKTSTFEVV